MGCRHGSGSRAQSRVTFLKVSMERGFGRRQKNGSDKRSHRPQAVAVGLWTLIVTGINRSHKNQACWEGDGIRLHPTSREVVIVDVIPKPSRLSSLYVAVAAASPIDAAVPLNIAVFVPNGRYPPEFAIWITLCYTVC